MTTSGMAGNDTFIFAPGDGNDTIADFKNGGDLDHIWLNGTDLHNFADVLSHASFDAASGNTTITYNGAQTIVLNAIAIGALTPADFIFS